MATCPKCNSEEIFISDFRPLQAGDSALGIYNPAGNYIRLQVTLCASCGFVELFTNKDELAKLPKLVTNGKWVKKVD